MITVKAVKPTTPASQAQEDYAEKKQEKRSFVPAAFLLFLTACAAYLQSFLPARLEAQEERPNNRHNAANEQGDPQLEEEASAAAQEAAPEEDAAPNTADRTAMSSDNVVPIRMALPMEIGDFMASDSPAIDFKGVERPDPVRIEGRPIGDGVRAVNDNRPSAHSEHPAPGGGGSGGGGGGGSAGGGGDDRPHGPRPPDIDTHRNRAPRISGPVQLRNVIGCEALTISTLALLSGATDPDGDALRITGLSASSGTLTQTPDGELVFSRDDGMLGEVTLTYTISDGFASVVQTAYFSVVEAPPIIGTAADDNILGTQCADRIDGGAGDDNIDARQGNDIIVGGLGDDHIVAGAGNDIVYAGEGNDVVFAGAGNDVVFGGAGNDRLYGEDGDDTIMGEDGNDVIAGGSGNDVLIAGAGDDVVQGDDGDDALDGGEGDDTLVAGSGNDVVMAAAGNDQVFGEGGNDVLSDGGGQDAVDGGTGNDHVIAAADAANDAYKGGDGQDTLDYSSSTFSVTVDLGRGRANGQDIGHDLIEAFEEVLGGSGDDRIIAGSTSVTMTGGKGRDTFEFHRSDDDDDPQAMTVRKITDFTVGDRIVAATYEISYLHEDGDDGAIADMFDDIYLSQNGNRPVRFRFEKLDDDDVTFVDVHDRPDTDDFYSIEVSGHHHLQFTVSVIG
jgi:Ca2+-binding RTX toxin-like protein